MNQTRRPPFRGKWVDATCNAILVTTLVIWAFQHFKAERLIPSTKRIEPIMGVTVSLYLFDLHRYEKSLLPAYREFIEKSDVGPLARLLEESLSIMAQSKGRHSSLLPVEVYREYLDILTGKIYYSSKGEEGGTMQQTSREDLRLFVDRSVAPVLLELMCVPEAVGFNPEQGMSGTRLTTYLYSQSRWIEDHFTFAKELSGPRLDITLGECSRLFSRGEIKTFDRELSRMARPSDADILADGFDNLRALVHAAAEHDNLGILLCIL